MNTQPTQEQYIPIHSIGLGNRLRALDEAEVVKKMDSIREIGLINAITVMPIDPRAIPENAAAAELSVKYRLCAGLHRLEACKRLGWKEIRASVTTLTGPRAQLIEVDENLMQTTLNAAQRAIFMNRRKELYLILHPETAKGKAQGEGMKRRADLAANVGHELVPNKVSTFVEDTAEKTGQSERTVRREAERGERIEPDVLQEVANAPALATGQTLDELKDLPPERQRERVKELKATPPKTRLETRRAAKQTSANAVSAAIQQSAKRLKGGPMEHTGGTSTLQHHGDGSDDQRKCDILRKLDPIFDALWLGIDPRENAAKIENILAEWNIIPVSDRKRDPRKHLRDLKSKAPKAKAPTVAAAMEMMNSALKTLTDEELAALKEDLKEGNDEDIIPVSELLQIISRQKSAH